MNIYRGNTTIKGLTILWTSPNYSKTALLMWNKKDLTNKIKKENFYSFILFYI
jgi:hypothetical protein